MKLPAEVAEVLKCVPASFAAGVKWAQSPLPSDLDHQFSSLLSYFTTAPEPLKQELFKRLSRRSGFLLVFAKRMATLAIRTNNASRLVPAVLALVLEDFSSDARDTMVTLSLVRHAALKTGADCRALMELAAQHAKPKAAKTFAQWPKGGPAFRTSAKWGTKRARPLMGLSSSKSSSPAEKVA